VGKCCLGLPAINVLLADNQRDIFRELSMIRAIYPFDAAVLDKIFAGNAGINALKYSSIVSSSLVDGYGCSRVAQRMLVKVQKSRFGLRPGTAEDCDYVFRLQSAPRARAYFRTPKLPTISEHKQWFSETLATDGRILFIIEEDETPVGMVRLDNVTGSPVEVSIIVESSHTGKGIAKRAVGAVLQLLPGREVKAVVHKENIASRRVFEGSNFGLIDDATIFWEYRYCGE
jgi:UDP-2,4-diacetamido-2,4,6-trideoxy-beta-L-altropyranose hydrolase